ncbi:MAG: histidine kinase N-terminal 7TM domain-containing protein, partial [Minisyncoccales bacterium]
MILYAFSGLINALFSTFFGFLVYFKDKKSKVNQSFFRFCFAVALWSYGYFFWQLSSGPESALFWSRVLMMGSIFIPSTFFHFVINFLKIFEKEKRKLILAYLLSFFFFIFIFTPLFVAKVEPILSFPYWPKPGIFFHFFHLMFISFTFYFWYLLLRSEKEAKGIFKKQIHYVLLGSFIGFLGGATNHFLWYDIPIPPFGNFFPFIGFSIVAFAILKYHLFEIRVILTEILVGV